MVIILQISLMIKCVKNKSYLITVYKNFNIYNLMKYFKREILNLALCLQLVYASTSLLILKSGQQDNIRIEISIYLI